MPYGPVAQPGLYVDNVLPPYMLDDAFLRGRKLVKFRGGPPL